MNQIRAQLDSIFYPESVAIIGASNREGSFGQLFLNGFIKMGFKNIYPVHPRDKELLGLTAYPSIKDVPHEIDMAILLVPQDGVIPVIQECADKKVKNIVLFTSGYSEKGPDGARAELDILKIVRKAGIRLIGPNTNGLYSPAASLLILPGGLTAGGLTTEVGDISVFSQSGSFNDYLTQVMVSKNIRFNKVVSCGNEADLSSADFLEYFGDDEGTRIIAGYLEGIKNGRKFYKLAKEISKKKPILIWKGGKTETGARAAMAHTGKLAGARHVWDSMFKQSGIIGINSFEELTDCLMAFSWLPIPEGNRVAIISGMGGTNVGTSDNCIGTGLEIAKISSSTQERLTEILPQVGAHAGNPADVGVAMLMNPKLYYETIKLMASDENVDMLIAVTGPDCPASVAHIMNAAKEIDKPLYVCLFEIHGLIESQVKLLLDNHIPITTDPGRAALALYRMAQYSEWLRMHKRRGK
jgi:acetyl-CoA synthetase (ADP-forming)